jgi:hypothetical protein
MALGTLERLEDELAEVCGHRNVLDARLVRLVADALETGVWEMPGPARVGGAAAVGAAGDGGGVRGR